ncbi:hypothetical protein BKA93DRAFT_68262 [Sparassis latifolia]
MMALTLGKGRQGPGEAGKHPLVVEVVLPPIRKRRRMQAQQPAIKHPSSPGLMDVPLDILFEIFCLLFPEDLLNLILTNKPFRDVLIDRSMDTVWKEVRKGYENLAACPPYLREHHYTDLIFGHHCQKCGATGPECSMSPCVYHFKDESLSEPTTFLKSNV